MPNVYTLALKFHHSNQANFITANFSTLFKPIYKSYSCNCFKILGIASNQT